MPNAIVYKLFKSFILALDSSFFIIPSRIINTEVKSTWVEIDMENVKKNMQRNS